MVSKIAWKNVWREKKRSLLVMAAVALGTTAGMFSTGVMQGWIRDHVNGNIDIRIAHLQIHNPRYLNNEEISNTISSSAVIFDSLQKNPFVQSFCGRKKVMSLAATSRGNTAMYLVGVQPEQEKKISSLYKKIIPLSGDYLSQEGKMQVVISDRIAEYLKIKSYVLTADILDSLQQAGMNSLIIDKLRLLQDQRFDKREQIQKAIGKQLSVQESNTCGRQLIDASVRYRQRAKIVFTCTDKDEKIVSQAFRVQGIYKTTDARFDMMNAFVFNTDLSSTLGMDTSEYHEIAIRLNNIENCHPVQKTLSLHFPDNSVMDWKETSPDIAMYGTYSDLFLIFFMGFIFCALAFGIVNTMLMAILERTRELGMLQAIGMNKRRIFTMIMLETLYLTSVGAVLGMIVGGGLVVITGHTGIHLASISEGLEAVGWSASFYPFIKLSDFVEVSLIVVVVSMLAAIVPARKALKLNPIEAIRKL